MREEFTAKVRSRKEKCHEYDDQEVDRFIMIGATLKWPSPLPHLEGYDDHEDALVTLSKEWLWGMRNVLSGMRVIKGERTEKKK